MKSRERILLWVALVVAVAAICLAILRTEPISIDWMGVLVAVLGILVATLIMWQIFTLIDVKKIRKEVAEDKDRVCLELEKNLAITFIALSDYYYLSLKGVSESQYERINKYIYCRVSSILHASNINDIKTCETVIKVLQETIRPEEISLRVPDKNYLFDLLSDVKRPRQISGLSELLVFLSKINEID